MIAVDFMKTDLTEVIFDYLFKSLIILNFKLKMSAKPAESKVAVKQPTVLASASNVSLVPFNQITETTIALNR